jgi:hypothetical protein
MIYFFDYIYLLVIDFLSIKELKNLLEISPKSNIKYFEDYIKKKSIKKIINFMIYTKFFLYNILKNNDLFLTRKHIAFYFLKNYDLNSNLWYNMEIPWKKKILEMYKEKYNLKKTNNPNKFDLFKLQKKMKVEDILNIGF